MLSTMRTTITMILAAMLALAGACEDENPKPSTVCHGTDLGVPMYYACEDYDGTNLERSCSLGYCFRGYCAEWCVTDDDCLLGQGSCIEDEAGAKVCASKCGPGEGATEYAPLFLDTEFASCVYGYWGYDADVCG